MHDDETTTSLPRARRKLTIVMFGPALPRELRETAILAYVFTRRRRRPYFTSKCLTTAITKFAINREYCRAVDEAGTRGGLQADVNV